MTVKLYAVDARRVVRETADFDPMYHRRLMVSLDAGGRLLTIWQKGRRTRFSVPYSAIWRLGYQMRARAAVAEKHARKNQRKKI
jgi:hypothetical protein